MAEFCTSCGAPLGQGMQFCTSCGAAKSAPPAPAAPARPAAPAPRPPVSPTAPSATLEPTAQAQAPKSSSPIVKIILIVLAVIVLIGMLSAASCVYFMYRARQRVRQFERQVHTTFPSRTGSSEMHPISPAVPTPPGGPAVDTGIAVYPGATPFGGGSQASGPTGSIKTQEYTTGDSVDKVVDFYKDKLGPNTSVMQAEGKAVLNNQSEAGAITVVAKPDSGDGKTHITIMLIGGK